jgi:hypothetical protein
MPEGWIALKTSAAILLAIILGVIAIMAVAGFFAVEWLDAHKDLIP